MERRIIDLVYENENAIYYRLSEKVDKKRILSKFLCKNETPEHTESTFEYEQHWLAVWSRQSAERFAEGTIVEFDFSSTSFYESMWHGSVKLENIRNFNVTKLKRIED